MSNRVRGILLADGFPFDGLYPLWEGPSTDEGRGTWRGFHRFFEVAGS